MPFPVLPAGSWWKWFCSVAVFSLARTRPGCCCHRTRSCSAAPRRQHSSTRRNRYWPPGDVSFPPPLTISRNPRIGLCCSYYSVRPCRTIERHNVWRRPFGYLFRPISSSSFDAADGSCIGSWGCFQLVGSPKKCDLVCLYWVVLSRSVCPSVSPPLQSPLYRFQLIIGKRNTIFCNYLYAPVRGKLIIHDLYDYTVHSYIMLRLTTR